MLIQSYLFFDGRCEEAIEFYKKALGAEVEMLLRFKDNPEQQQETKAPPGAENKVMHSSVRIGETSVMMSDGHCTGKPMFQGFQLALSIESVAEVERGFAALAEGGRVVMPLGKTFFSPSFGMVVDKFGVQWAVIAAGTRP